MTDPIAILDRVKNRLNAQTTERDQTQVIPDFSQSILFVEPQQPAAPKKRAQSNKTQPLEAVKLPQLHLDESDFLSPAQDARPVSPFADTQVIQTPRPARPSLTTQVTTEDKTQATQLQDEISHVSLTDEENDLNDEGSTTLDSSVQKNITTKAELDQIDRELSEQKRLRSIKPAFTESENNPVQDLLDAFDSDQESHLDFGGGPPKHSPSTSPMKDIAAKHINELESEPEFETENVIDVISKAPQTLRVSKPKRTPIDEYARRLKNTLASSPTKDSPVIILDDSEHEGLNQQPSEDEIPKLSKEKAFLLKQKFSKRHLASGQRAAPSLQKRSSLTSHKALFDHLRRANTKQLADRRSANPDLELIEEIEKEEEEMGNLLEREMERARRIRRKEKAHEKALEKAKLVLDRNDDAEYQEGSGSELNESEVPDSELGSDLDSQDSDMDSSDVDSAAAKARRIRARQVVTSDEGDSDLDNNSEVKVTQDDRDEQDDHNQGRSDDSYMFGGPAKAAPLVHDEEDPIMHIHSDHTLPESPLKPGVDPQVASIKENLPRLFQNLAPRMPKTQALTISSDGPVDSLKSIDSFQELLPTQASDFTLEIQAGRALDQPTQKDNVPNQSTQADDVPESTQVDNVPDQSTQVDSGLLTRIDSQESIFGKQSMEFLKRNTQVPISEELDESEGEPRDEGNDRQTEQKEAEQELKRKLDIYEAKIRRREVQSRKRRKEMERRGLKGIVDGEAEESEDEWKGVGGADMEFSDQADSEDERMIDNTLNLDLNDEEVRRKFMEQYQIKDRSELEKLIDDIQNHKLTKRARANRFDIELSDEEDEILMEYRRQKLEEQKRRLMANQKLMKDSKNARYTAFFDSIDDEADPFMLNEESETDTNHEYDVSQDSRIAKEESAVTDDKSAKKKIVIEESFVQRQLSFLSKADDTYAHAQEEADRQHGVEELSELKSRCLSSLYANCGSSFSLGETRKRPSEDVATDEDEDEEEIGFSSIFKKPSVVSSFKAFHEKKGVQVSTNSFSGVTVNKQYKAAAGSKASITYMSKKKTKGVLHSTVKSSRLEEIERQLDAVKSGGRLGGSGPDRSFS